MNAREINPLIVGHAGTARSVFESRTLSSSHQNRNIALVIQFCYAMAKLDSLKA